MPFPEWTLLLLAIYAPPVSPMLHCDKILTSNRKFDLSPLKGPHSVTVSRLVGPNFHNTTYTTDICQALKKKKKEGDKEGSSCPNGSRVCAIERIVSPDAAMDLVDKVIPIAGELADHGGGHLDHVLENLSTSDSNEDSKKQGVRITLKGGMFQENGQKRKQQAIIEFVCDEKRTGLEGEWKAEDEYEPDGQPTRLRMREDGGDGQKPDEPIQLGEGKNASLVFNSYGPLGDDGNVDVLRLTWRTMHACERSDDGSGGDDSNGEQPPNNRWGFFTWLFVL